MKMDTMSAVIGKVTPTADGWEIALMPDNTTWLSVYRADFRRAPKVGDFVTVRVPKVLAISRVRFA